MADREQCPSFRLVADGRELYFCEYPVGHPGQHRAALVWSDGTLDSGTLRESHADLPDL